LSSIASYAPQGCGAFIEKLLRITFRLYMTFWPAHKANRRFAAGQNVAEKNPTKGAARLGFFGARTASAVRIYRPVRRSFFCLCYYLFIF
jgi:hypothetical protein